MRRSVALLLALLGMLLGGCGGGGVSNHVTFYAVTTTGQLVRFASTNPSLVIPVTVTGTLAPLQAVEFLAFENVIYAVDTAGRAYKIVPNTGVATVLGTPFASGLNLDVDSIIGTNLLRVVDTADDNLRIDTGTGTVTTDTTLAYAGGDAHSGDNPQIVGVARDNAVNGVTYGIDSQANTLVTVGSPESANSGVLHTRGLLGVDTDDNAGLEVGSNGFLYAALHTSGFGGGSRLYFVDPVTGSCFLIGNIGTTDPIISLTSTH